MKRYPILFSVGIVLAVALVLVFGLGLTPQDVAFGTATGGLVLADGASAAAIKELETKLDETVKTFSETNDAVKKLAEKAEKELGETAKLSTETRAETDKALIAISRLAAQVGDIEQKLQSRRSAKVAEASTPGGRFVASDAFKGLGEEGNRSGRFGRGHVLRMQVPQSEFRMGEYGVPLPSAAITTQGTAGLMVEEMRIPGVQALPQRRMTVRNLIAPGRTISNAFKYIREVSFTNEARVVSESKEKPESTMVLEAVTGNVATIAHWMHASKQILDDAPGLQSMIDNRLRYGLQLAEEAQLLRGDGTGDNLEGLITAATAYNGAILDVDQETEIDEIRKAILQVYLSEYPADGIVMHPTNWARIELRKTTEGAYLMANPAGVLGKRLWGLPVVDTQAMETNEFLVGAFGIAAQIFDREDANVAISSEDRDNFIKNMVTILAEERLALAIYRSTAMVTGDFVHVSG